MFYKVYLSGPMSGLTYDEASEWRNYVYEELGDWLEILDPMRDRISPTPESLDTEWTSIDESMLTDRGIMTRDHRDLIASDMAFINLLGTKRVTIGTMAELFWAFDRRIPTVVVMEPTGNVHDHPFVREAAHYRVDTIDRGIEIVRSVLAIPAEPTWG